MDRREGAHVGQSGRVRSAGRRHLAIAALVVATVGLSGCSAELTDQLKRLGLPEASTEESSLIGNLWIGSWIAAFGVGFLVWGLIIWSVIVYRRRSADEMPRQTRFNMPIEFLYTTTPLVVITAMFYFTVDHQEQIVDTSTEPDLTVEVVGQQWSWTFNYVDEDVHTVGTINEPPTLYLPINQTVRFELKSPDVIHSFWVPSFYMKMDAIPGQDNVFQVTPNREGVFAGKCAELCGVYHQSMLFDVAIVSQDEYEDHIDDLRAAGNTGLIEVPLRGAFSETPLSEGGSGQ